MDKKNNVELIAETAWHHTGKFDYFKKLIKEICKLNVDIVKVHVTLDINEYIDKNHNSYKVLKNMIFTKDQWKTIFDIILKSKKKILCLVNDTDAIRFCSKFSKITYYELHTVCATDPILMKNIKKNPNVKKLFVGSSGLNISEIKYIIKYFKQKLVLMHGIQSYPTKIKDINFNKIIFLKNKFNNIEHGYADHTLYSDLNNESITIAGTILCGKYCEKHITINPGNKKYLDWESAISIQQTKSLSLLIKNFNFITKKKLNHISSAEKKYASNIGMKKICILNKNVFKGDFIKLKHFDFKRSSKRFGISTFEIKKYFGKKYKKNFKAGTVFTN